MLGGNIRGLTRTITTAITLETSQGEFPSAFALGIVLLALGGTFAAGPVTLEGEFVDQIVWGEDRFARNLALSADPEQQFLYVGGGTGIMVLDRDTLEILTTIETDVGPGHQIQTDAEGNLYIAATGSGYQRLMFTGLEPR